MKRCLAAFAITASLFVPVTHANDALEAKVRAYVPVVSLVKVCDCPRCATRAEAQNATSAEAHGQKQKSSPLGR
jgi:hypothetical protein